MDVYSMNCVSTSSAICSLQRKTYRPRASASQHHIKFVDLCAIAILLSAIAVLGGTILLGAIAIL